MEGDLKRLHHQVRALQSQATMEYRDLLDQAYEVRFRADKESKGDLEEEMKNLMLAAEDLNERIRTDLVDFLEDASNEYANRVEEERQRLDAVTSEQEFQERVIDILERIKFNQLMQFKVEHASPDDLEELLIEYSHDRDSLEVILFATNKGSHGYGSVRAAAREALERLDEEELRELKGSKLGDLTDVLWELQEWLEEAKEDLEMKSGNLRDVDNRFTYVQTDGTLVDRNIRSDFSL